MQPSDAQEIKVYKLLSHKSMVKYIGSCLDESKKFCLIMERAIGDTLDINIMEEVNYYKTIRIQKLKLKENFNEKDVKAVRNSFYCFFFIFDRISPKFFHLNKRFQSSYKFVIF